MGLQTVEMEPTNELSQWFDGLITRFRLEAAKLSEDQRKRIPNTDNYLEPCQVEIFWLEQPEYQTIISSRFADRPDREIIINGPYKGYDFIDKVDAVLRKPRWTKPLPKSAPFVVASKRSTLADVMYGIIANQIRQITTSLFTKIERVGPAGGQILTSESWVGLFTGNIAKTDPVAMVDQILASAKAHAAQVSITQSQPQPPAEVQAIQAAIGYVYPPITIGSLPEPQTLREFLNPGIHYFSMMKKALDGKVGSERIVFTRDGLMAATTTKKPIAVRIFNVISALMLLEGVPVQAIRESEIGQGTLDPATRELRGWGMSGSTPRTMHLQERMFRRLSWFQESRPSISETELSAVVEKADKILSHPKKAEELILWLESNTHFQNAEFAPSFVISWILIERNLSNSWESFLGEKNVRGDRKHKLVNAGVWPADSVLETLNLAGVMAEREYKTLMELKSKRNSFVHEGSIITMDDASDCLNLATEIMKHDLEGLL